MRPSGRAGAVVELPDGADHALAGRVRGDVGAAGHVGWVLLAVKTHQIAATSGWLERLCGPGTVIAVLQNGVEHEALVAPLAGPATILPAIVGPRRDRRPWARAPARARATERARDAGGRRPGRAARRRRARRLRRRLSHRDVAQLCFNAAAAPMVLTGRRAEVFREPAVMALARRLAEEGVAVGRAEGARLGPETVEEIVARIEALAPDQGTSMLFDRLAGRQMEWTPATA